MACLSLSQGSIMTSTHFLDSNIKPSRTLLYERFHMHWTLLDYSRAGVVSIPMLFVYCR